MGPGKNKLEPFSCIRNVNDEDKKGLATTGQRSKSGKGCFERKGLGEFEQVKTFLNI